MTNEQRAEAYLMLLNGATIREASEKYGVSYQRIQQMFPGVSRRGRKYKCIYPNIGSWINLNCATLHKFAELIGVSHESVHNYLAVERLPNKKLIDKILEVTGMTYEEAFKR